jgi:hypothetical protein
MRPTEQTIRRLFALSGNRCAFPGCLSKLTDGKTLICQICHIKAASQEGPRYDPEQSNIDRHGFDNLILLCANHHKVIDDDIEAYTVDRLLKMKRHHEQTSVPISQDDINTGTLLLLSLNQSGGITAHSIVANTINIQSAASGIDPETVRRRMLLGARKLHEMHCKRIMSRTGPVVLLPGPALVFHIVPAIALEDGVVAPFETVSNNPMLFKPIGGHLSDFRIDFDGLITGSNAEGLSNPQRAYVQIFRSGVLEAAVTSFNYGEKGNCVVLPQIQVMLFHYARLYTKSLATCEIKPPFVVCASLICAEGMRLCQDFLANAWFDIPFRLLDRDCLYFGETLLNDVPCSDNESAKQLKPILDHIANTSGLASSPYFDNEGNYTLKIPSA